MQTQPAAPPGGDAINKSVQKQPQEILPEQITVAIFCALAEESVAVRYSLDEKFKCHYKTIGPRNYVYSFGRVGDHNVVIARPTQMGPISAALCAATVNQQFPNVRFALMVGIGAGIPSPPKRDIRLGDIAVGIPRDGHPGVLQYDFGKYESDGKFVLKGTLNKPPPILIGADGSLQEDEMIDEMDENPLLGILEDITKHRGYARPNSVDVLFDPTFHHLNSGEDCKGCEASNEKVVVSRPEREESCGQPVVHRGLILSGGGVIKNTDDRDRLRRGEKDAICFEMEAAGIADAIPCLVIRGICDYADTHKQDGWHCYAAAVAAAYAKAILLKFDGQEVEETKTMRETMQELEEKINEINKNTEVIRDRALDAEREKVLDWLTPFDYDLQQSYISKRQHGTGQWLLDSAEFQGWLVADNQTLFCPGIPGAGKSFMTAIVIDHLHANYKRFNVAYLYCNVGQQSQQTPEGLLGSILKQLVRGQSPFPKDIKDLYDRHKDKPSRPVLKEISDVLQSVISPDSRTFIIIDALDECQNHDGCRDSLLSEVFTLQDKTRLNIFATSRPQEVQAKFSTSIVLEIRATDRDIETYLDGRISLWNTLHKNSLDDIRDMIKTELARIAGGMFLLAALNMSTLESQLNKGEVRDALRRIADGENKLDDAYEQTVERITRQTEERSLLAKKVLAWTFYAKRPLTITELLHALAVKPYASNMDEDYLHDEKTALSVCGGLVRLDERSKIIDFIHATTRDYFERNEGTWFQDAESDITITCVTYLSFSIFKSGPCQTDEEFEGRLRSNPLYHYAAHNWGHHARVSGCYCKGVIEFLTNGAQIEASSQALLAEHRWYEPPYSQNFPRGMTGLHLAAYFGIQKAVEIPSKLGQSLDAIDRYTRTPLSYAAENGHEVVVEELLATGKVDIDSKDDSDQTPLSWAAENGHEAVVKLLLATGKVDVDSKDKYGQTPLSWTAENGHEAVVKLLLATGKVDVDSKDKYGQTPLSWTAANGHEAVVKLLLATGKVDVDSKDSEYGRTPLSYASENGHEAVVKLLLVTGKVDVDSTDIKYGQTPLSYASESGHEAVVKLLIATGKADVDSKDNNGQTPLSWAAENRHEAVVKLLLATGKVDVDSKDIKYGQTPLSYASENGHEALVKLLIVTGKVDVDSKDNNGQTPLSWAAKRGHEAVVKLLLATGKVDVDSKDNLRRTPLSWAAGRGHEAMVKLLLATGKVDIDPKDSEHGRTPLSWAAEGGHEAVVKLLQSAVTTLKTL